MLKRKLSTLILAATITNLVATPANVFAETLTQNNVIQADEVVEENQSKEATVSKFSLYGSKLLESYNEVFKMDNSNIDSITNNGGKYGSSTIDKAIDDPIIATISGVQSWSTDKTVATTCTSFLNPFGNNGLIGLSISLDVNIAFSEGLPSLFKNPPGIFPTEYSLSS